MFGELSPKVPGLNNNNVFNNSLYGYTTTVTAGGTTLLSNNSTYQQIFTGSTTQTVTLPLANTMAVGQSFLIANHSSGTVTVTSVSGGTVVTVYGNSAAIVTCVTNSGSAASAWSATNFVVLNTSGSIAINGSSVSNAGSAFALGSSCSATANYAFAFGDACSASGEWSFAGGNGTGASGNYGFAFGNNCDSTNAGSWVTCDSTGTYNDDTAANQWVGTYAGGFYMWIGASLGLKVDTHLNTTTNNVIYGYATTATAAATTTLTVTSSALQYFTGSTTQTVLLPVTSTLALGFKYTIVNNSTGVVTVQSSGSNTIQAMAAGTTLVVTCILTSGTTAASWSAVYQTNSGAYLPLSGGTLTGNIAFSPTTDGITGTTTNDSVSTGTVGEYVSSQILAASAISISTATATNLTSISLTAGDWEVWGIVNFIASGNIGSNYIAWVSSTSATLPDQSLWSFASFPLSLSGSNGLVTFRQRFSLSTTTTIYVSGYTSFATGSMTFCGQINARRMR